MPRSAWTDVEPGPLEPEEVRFLIVHHTASATKHEPDEAPGILRGIRSYHVETKGWSDVAYNFLIDRHGTVWEGRAGSLDGPVRGDATGGNQGFTQLVCLIGDFTEEPPTDAAQQALISTLAWLAARYEVDVRLGHTISFVSRGSNRWPAGSTVTTTPIAGHRDMSKTTCPGDSFYPMLGEVIAPAVREQLTPVTSTSTSSATTTSSPSTTATSQAAESSSTSMVVTSTTTVAAATPDDDGGLRWPLVAIAGGLLAGLIGWRMRRMGGR